MKLTAEMLERVAALFTEALPAEERATSACTLPEARRNLLHSWAAVALEEEDEFDGCVVETAGLHPRDYISEKAIAIIQYQNLVLWSALTELTFKNEVIRLSAAGHRFALIERLTKPLKDEVIFAEWVVRAAERYMRKQGWEPTG